MTVGHHGESQMKPWTLHYYAGDLMKYGCSCCSNQTMRWRKKEFRWKWMARLSRWWLMHGPVVGMQVLIGGWNNMYDPRVEPTTK